MKKRIFKFGAALTAALMMFSATASLAFATEDVVEPDTTIENVEIATPEDSAKDVVEDADAEDVEAPAEDAEAPVEDVEVPLDTEVVTEGEAELEAKVNDVATGSIITIGEISSSSDENYYSVQVPFTLAAGATAPSQMTFFVYDISQITGDQNNTIGFQSTTPVGYINQYDGTATGTYSFKLAKTDGYIDSSIIVVKIGGTGVSTPDAKSYTLGENPVEYKYGDVNHDKSVNGKDASLVMQYYRGKIGDDALDLSIADAYKDGKYNGLDSSAIMQYYRGRVESLPIIPEK